MVIVLVHGGAANIPQNHRNEKINACIKAARNGCQKLLQGGNSVDAVVASVSVMEDEPSLNAGYGSSLTIEGKHLRLAPIWKSGSKFIIQACPLSSQGTVENDAIVMDGQTMDLGAVACVTRIQNPVRLARLVMEQNDHCILAGHGAHQFAKLHKIPLIENERLVHQNARNRLDKCTSFAQTIKNSIGNGLVNGKTERSIKGHSNAIKNALTNGHSNGSTQLVDNHDTVGAVALDAQGHLACATSTGGLTGKAIGRIGDSPLAGSGGWAEDEVGAFSTTGHGERIMRVALAKHIAMLSQVSRLSLEEAVDQGLEYMKERVGGAAGVAALGPQGQVVVRHTTLHMIWACADSERGTITYGYDQNEVFNQPLDASNLSPSPLEWANQSTQ